MQKQNYKLANKTEKIEKKGKYQSRKMPKNSITKIVENYYFYLGTEKMKAISKIQVAGKRKPIGKKTLLQVRLKSLTKT